MDPKPSGRARDPELLKVLHLRWKTCALCGSTGFTTGWTWLGLSLHHINRHPRDDVEGNLIMVCGSGTTGCHGRIEARNPPKLWKLAAYLRESRPDALEYLDARFPQEGADNWLQRVLGA